MGATGLAQSKPVLSKLDVAKRQLDTAIWLWFNEGDIVSINTLAGAAFGVLDDLTHNRWKRRPYPFSKAPEGIAKNTWMNWLKAAQSFAKHARHDFEGVHEYNPEKTRRYMYHACIALILLTPGEYDSVGLRFLFMLHCGLGNPGWPGPMFIPQEGSRVVDDRLKVDELKKLSRSEFFEKLGGNHRRHPPRPDMPN